MESVGFVAVWLVISLAAMGLGAFYLKRAGEVAGGLGLPLDDGWIHVRFAENLARGHGFSFNPGEPTSTTTSPLWTLLLGLIYRFSGERVFASIVTNYALLLLLCAAVYMLSRAYVSSRWFALSVAAVVAVTVPLPWWLLSGMEPMLYAVLAITGMALHVRLRSDAGAKGLLPTVVFALASLARPEMLVLFPVAMTDRLMGLARDERGAALRRWGRGLAVHVPVFAIIIAPFFLYNYRTTGYPLPTSYYSKLQWMGVLGALVNPEVSLSSALIIGPIREIWDVLRAWASNNCLLIAGLPIGVVWLAARWHSGKNKAGGFGSALVLLVILSQPVIWAWVGGYRPPAYQSQRYIANLNALYVMVAMLGGWWVVERFPKNHRFPVRVTLLIAVLAVSLLRHPGAAKTYSLNVKNTNEMQVAIGRWLKENAAPDALIAVNDIGAIGLFSDLRVLDLQGLVTPEVLALRDMRRRLDGSASAALFEFITEHRPDYLVVFPQWYPGLDGRRDLFTPVYVVAIEDKITNGAPVMIVYRTIWADEWQESQ